MSDTNYLEGLNEAQRAPVVHIDGPLMVIAGAGSGKTRVLTYRIAHLIQQGVDPFRILALTFTNKAAREMKDRIEKIVGQEARNLWVGTFHSIFSRILRIDGHRLGYQANFSIYDTNDSKSLIKSIVKEMGLDEKLYKPGFVYFRISSAKNSLYTPTEYQQDIDIVSEDESSGRPKIGKIYEQYALRCWKAGAMDFDDLIMKTYQLLDQHPEALYKYQDKFRHIMIDEFQDTNFAQYTTIKMLADMHQNLCVVGDDAQSIYAFRGANIRNILNFEKDYPERKVYKLEQNYRSSKNILEAANHVIAKNKQQFKKNLWTDQQPGNQILLTEAISDNDEGKQIADLIFEEKMRMKRMNQDFAILYRTNAQSRSFEEALRRMNIPYKVYGGLSFYQRKEIKDVLAYLKLTVNHKDEEALRRIINYPKRGIGKTTMDRITVMASETEKSMWEVIATIGESSFSGRVKTVISEFVTKIKSFAVMMEDQNAYDVSMHIAKSSGLLNDLYNDKSVEGLSRFENVQELLNGIKEFTESDLVNPESGELMNPDLATFLQDVMLLTDQDNSKEVVDTVTLMTIHAAKGLEFPFVFIVGLEENLFPNQMSMGTREELEEERRLFYVGITRAEEKLSLSFARSRYRWGSLQYCEPSRFLDEVPEALVEKRGSNSTTTSSSSVAERRKAFIKVMPQKKQPQFDANPNFVPNDISGLQEGMDVEHQRFGVGKVLRLEGSAASRIATVDFSSIGEKRIMLKFAKLKML